MTENRDDEGRDREIGHALRGLPMPQESSEFWSDLRRKLVASAGVEAAEPRLSDSESAGQDQFQAKQNQAMPTKTQHRPQLFDVNSAPEQRERPSWMIGVAASILLIAGVVGYQVLFNQEDSLVLLDEAEQVPTGPITTISTPTTDPPTVNPLAIKQSDLRNLAYPSEWDLDTGVIQLNDGRWEGEPADGPGSTFPVVTLVEHIGSPTDGASAVVVLAGDGGGSGTFYELYLVSRLADGSLHVSQPVSLGDRITFTTLTFDGSTVVAIYTDHFDTAFDQQFISVDGELT